MSSFVTADFDSFLQGLKIAEVDYTLLESGRYLPHFWEYSRLHARLIHYIGHPHNQSEAEELSLPLKRGAFTMKDGSRWIIDEFVRETTLFDDNLYSENGQAHYVPHLGEWTAVQAYVYLSDEPPTFEGEDGHRIVGESYSTDE